MTAEDILSARVLHAWHRYPDASVSPTPSGSSRAIVVPRALSKGPEYEGEIANVHRWRDEAGFTAQFGFVTVGVFPTLAEAEAAADAQAVADGWTLTDVPEPE